MKIMFRISWWKLKILEMKILQFFIFVLQKIELTVGLWHSTIMVAPMGKNGPWFHIMERLLRVLSTLLTSGKIGKRKKVSKDGWVGPGTSQNVRETLEQGFEIRLSDRSLGIFYNNGIEIIFHSSNDEFPIIRREFQVLMAQQNGSRTARFTVTDVFYRFKSFTIPRLNSGIRNRQNFFLWAIFLFSRVGNESVNYADLLGIPSPVKSIIGQFFVHIFFQRQTAPIRLVLKDVKLRIFWSMRKVCRTISTYPNAHAKVQNWIFDVQFPGNWFRSGIIWNDFWSITIWAIQIEVSLADLQNRKNPGIQPNHIVFNTWPTLNMI